jgi:hypothetical protein
MEEVGDGHEILTTSQQRGETRIKIDNDGCLSVCQSVLYSQNFINKVCVQKDCFIAVNIESV